MTVHRDISIVRRFMDRELVERELGGPSRYVEAARSAREAFERLASYVGEEERAKQLREFDEIWPAPTEGEE